jgi:hypothetical protein
MAKAFISLKRLLYDGKSSLEDADGTIAKWIG